MQHWSDFMNPHLNANAKEEDLLRQIEDVEFELKQLQENPNATEEEVEELEFELLELRLELKRFK